ncbi:DUF1152 domain-containing protein [Sulfurisphaera ohwakuensis]|uniref:DUF1152 domain-containing protein n=2 Tax=Sulfurisphaera ohwakuensis TaxID=69656 RepID=A0A7J9RUI8_SULOH|nr:DUF1152 domain-containing protein [Sulfurisphaera ohwakuensis]MBB5252904.1 hypothetical protein [Sulfurisphaera ohwakuensis]
MSKRLNMNAFVFGLGGGGDVASTYIVMKYLSLKNISSIVGAVTWERYVEDPLPGPICKEDMKNIVMINDVITEVNQSSYAIRNGLAVIPQLVRFLKAMKIDKGYSICIKYGPKSIAEGIADLASRLNTNFIIGVDAGGDVLAKGCEETLGSPLIDFLMLASLVELENMGFNVLLATIGAGSDGELEQEYILKRISEIARNEGLIDIKGIDKDMERDLEIILSNVNTEASRIPLEAFKGLYGEIPIRNGTRRVKVSPVSSIMFFLDPKKVAYTSPLYDIVKNSSSLDDANRKLNEVGIYTEYNFELDLYAKFGLNARNIDSEKILQIRSEGRRKLGGLKINC